MYVYIYIDISPAVGASITAAAAGKRDVFECGIRWYDSTRQPGFDKERYKK